MEPSIWTKQVWEERLLEFDATDSLATGDTVASISGIAVYEGTVDKSLTMISGAPSLIGNKAYARIIAGEDGHNYFVRVRLVTTNGDKIEDDLKILVRNIGG
jgi:hypothetical protein